MLISMLLFSVPYVLTRLQLSPAAARGRMGLLLALLLCATVVATPVSLVFLVGPLLLLLGLGWATPGLITLRRAFLVACTPVRTFALVLAINYYTSGIVEVTPLKIFARVYDHERIISCWFPATALKIMVFGNQGIDGYVFPAAALLGLLGKCALAAGLAALLHRRLGAVVPVLLKRLWLVLLPVLSLGALCPVLQIVAEQPSLKRFLVFLPPLQIVLVIGGLLGVLAAAAPWHCARKGSGTPARAIATVLFGAAALYGLIFNWTPKLAEQRTATRAFFGVTSMQPLFGHWREEWMIAEKVDARLPKDDSVLPLQFAPYADLYSARFLRPMECARLQELPTMLGADPDAAAAAYLRACIRHFLVKLPQAYSVYDTLGFPADGALFEPANIARHFRAVEVGDDTWLLVLHGTDADGPPPDEAIFSAYGRRRAWNAAIPPNWMIDSLRRARKQVPELALAPLPQ